MNIAPAHYPIIIALCSVILVPFVVWAIRSVWALWSENRDARLAKAIEARLAGYVTSEDFEMKIETMRAHVDELHEQNRDFLDTIRTEGIKREGMILGAIEAQAKERRADAEAVTTAVGEVHRRVDQILLYQVHGDRRHQP